MLLQRPALSTSRVAPRAAPRLPSSRPQRQVSAHAAENFFISLLTSALGGAIVGVVTTVTSENKEKEVERLQTVDGALPLVAAVGVDTIVHTIPVLGDLLALVAEPLGAAAGVAYLMSIVLSSPQVDPKTLAPKGTILNAEKVSKSDARAKLRIPFTKVIPTALEVVDTTNSSSDGAGWTIGESGLPKLPITSVLIVLAVGGTIVELLSHAPVLALFMPRALQTAAYYAAAGAVLDKRE